MKLKRIFLVTAIILIAGFWWKSQPGSSLQTSPEYSRPLEIISNDKLKLERNFKPEILSHKYWQQVNDYALNPINLVNKDNASELFRLTQAGVKDLAICLKKNFCGMERRSEDDAYFDDKKTPGHILLGRNLEIMLESLRQNPELKKQIDWDLIKGLTDSENEKIQILALDIIKNYDTNNADANKLLDIAEKYKGNAKASALEKIASSIASNNRLGLVNALEQSFSQDDPDTVINIVEKLNSMHLSQDELLKVSRNLCRFKEQGSNSPNWKMIKYNMKKLVDIESICN